MVLPKREGPEAPVVQPGDGPVRLTDPQPTPRIEVELVGVDDRAVRRTGPRPNQAPDRCRVRLRRHHKDTGVVGEQEVAVGPPDEGLGVPALQGGLIRRERLAVVAREAIVRRDPQEADAVARDGTHFVGAKTLARPVLSVEELLCPPHRGEQRQHQYPQETLPHRQSNSLIEVRR